MSDNNQNNESLLEAWLQLSMTLWNERFVSYMSYNDAIICRLLYKQRFLHPESPSLNLMQLSKRTGISKSQMNKTLASLEAKNFITRTRSELDKRVIFITLNDSMVELYENEHSSVMNVVDKVADRLGPDKTNTAIEIFNDISNIICDIDKRQ